MAEKAKSAADRLKELEAQVTNEKSIDTTFVETNNIGLDMGLTNGRGLPQGWSIAMYADPGCGKTTLCGDMIYRLIKGHKEKGIPYKVVYIDAEGSKELLKEMGLREFMLSKDLLHIEGQVTFEKLELIYDQILAKKGIFADVKLVVIDSITNILSEVLAEKSCGAADFGSNAKERGRFYPKYLPLCKTQGVTSIFISQVRVKQGASNFEDPKRAAIVDLDKHNMDIIAKFSKSVSKSNKDIKEITVKTAFGEVKTQDRFILKMSTSTAANTKNRAGRIPDVEVLVQYGKRVINTFTLRNILAGLGYVAIDSYCTVGNELLDEFDPEDKLGLRDKKVRVKDVNSFIRQNIVGIKEFLKMRDQYKLDLGSIRDDETDDGM